MGGNEELRKAAAWTAAARRMVVGERVEIKTLPDGPWWVKPRKFSVAGEDAVMAWSIKRQSRMNRESVTALIQRAKATGEDPKDLSNDVILDVLGQADPELFAQADLIRLHIRYGIAEHNFEEGAQAPTEEWIDRLLDLAPATAREVAEIAKEFQAPLGQATSGISATSSSGSSTESPTT